MTDWSSPRMVLEWAGLVPQLSKTQTPWAFTDSWVGTELAPSLRQPWYQTTLQGGKGGWPSAQHLSSNICKRGSSPQCGAPHPSVRMVTHWLFHDSLNITGKKKVCFFLCFEGSGCSGKKGYVCLCKNKSWPFHYITVYIYIYIYIYIKRTWEYLEIHRTEYLFTLHSTNSYWVTTEHSLI